MLTSDYDYSLPQDLIAQVPLPRGESRMLVLHKRDGHIEHRRFHDLPQYLKSGDTLVLNDTRVSARRLRVLRENGQPAEALFLNRVGDRAWSALVRPGKRTRVGAKLCVQIGQDSFSEALVTETTPEGGRIIEFGRCEDAAAISNAGEAPLPPYIHAKLTDEERYQTIYNRAPGSAAAPTAGLHFTPEIIERVRTKDVEVAWTTLHVGVDTFRPLKTPDLSSHVMHGERFEISERNAQVISSTSGKVIAIGTTSVRALESAATEGGKVEPMASETRLFITPGYRFKVVQGLLTNFHLPKSTLLVLVSAFAGKSSVLAAYEEAVRERYRFYSFGDAMLII